MANQQHPTPRHPSPKSIAVEQLDLLVDGELDEPDRRTLLQRLEQQPDGWRRCALAFLEAQSWHRELRGIFEEIDSETSATVDRVITAGTAEQASGGTPAGTGETPVVPVWSAGRRGHRVPRSSTVLAMAASFIVALTLSLVVQNMWRAGSADVRTPVDRLAQSATDSEGVSAAAEQSEPNTAPGIVRPRPAGDRPWQTVTLVSDGEQPQRIDVPVRQRDSFDSSWLRQLPAPIPPEVREALERMGRRVRHHRELMPIELEDGRRLILPVDEIELDPADEPPM